MILAVARTHLARLKRDRAGLTLSFVVPIVFFTVFALIFGGPRGQTRQVPLAVVNEDGSENARRFVEALKSEKGLRVETGVIPEGASAEIPYSRATAEEAVKAGRLPLALVIPAGFGDAPIHFGPSGDAPRARCCWPTARTPSPRRS